MSVFLKQALLRFWKMILFSRGKWPLILDPDGTIIHVADFFPLIRLRQWQPTTSAHRFVIAAKASRYYRDDNPPRRFSASRRSRVYFQPP